MRHQNPSDGISIPWRSSTVQVILVSSLVVPLSVALVSPGLPVVREVFDLTDARASLLISAILAPGIVLSPFVGLLTDRVGGRPVLVGSLLLWSLAGASIVLEPSYSVVLALRVLQGATLAGIAITTVTLIGNTFDGARRNAVLGVNVAMISVGAAVYPIVGGYLFDIAWNLPFFLYLVGIPVALFAAVSLTDPVVVHESRTRTYLRHMIQALSWRDATVLYGSALAVDLLLFGAVFTALPFFLATRFGLSPALIGLVVTAEAVGSMLSATENGRLSRLLSDGVLVSLGFGAIGAGLLGAWMAQSPVFVGVAAFVVGTGWGLAVPSIDDGISELVSSSVLGGALSLRNSTSFIGRAGGPVLFAFIGYTTGYRFLLLAAGVAAVAWALLVVLVRE